MYISYQVLKISKFNLDSFHDKYRTSYRNHVLNFIATYFFHRFFNASNRFVNSSKSSSGGDVYVGGGVATLVALPFPSSSSSVGGISGKLGVFRPLGPPAAGSNSEISRSLPSSFHSSSA